MQWSTYVPLFTTGRYAGSRIAQSARLFDFKQQIACKMEY
jgi:hypothetical protein